MQIVTTVNLNGNAYQFEDSGYAALGEYLERAESQLRENPDRAEIVADLEQAIAEKCRKFLGPHKSVVSAAELDQIIKEMGPSGRRYRAMISGVCKGLAAFFNVDVTLIRILFVVLAVLTKGVWIFAYVLLMFVIPYADTPEERAAAQGMPFSAQVLIDQAKRNYAEFRAGKRWKRHGSVTSTFQPFVISSTAFRRCGTTCAIKPGRAVERSHAR